MPSKRILFLLLSFSLPLSAQTPHDGDWWRSLAPGSKQDCVVGFIDGMALGHNLSLMGSGNSSDPDCRTKIAQSYSYVMNRFFRNLETDQVVSSLDQLYDDGDNSSIIIGRAVWIVVNQLGGADSDEVRKLVEQSRGMRY